MSTKWAMMADFSIELADRAGELASLSVRLEEAEIELYGLWGYGGVNGKARFYCVPKNADEFRSFIREQNLQFQEGLTIFLSGADRGGALVEMLDVVATGGINLHAIQAVAVNGEFGCFVWADPQDWDRLAKMLE